jgi:hypothetical protein
MGGQEEVHAMRLTVDCLSVKDFK